MITLKLLEFNVLCAQRDIPSQRQLCLKAGVDIMSFSRWLNGHTVPNLRLVSAICSVLKCQPGDILQYSADAK